MFLNYFLTAFRQILKNRGRSALTMLGIIIGITSVIFVMTSGQIAKRFLFSQLSEITKNVIDIYPSQDPTELKGEKGLTFTEADIQAMYDSYFLPEIVALSTPYSDGQITMQVRDKEYDEIRLIGDRPEGFAFDGAGLLDGRLYNTTDFYHSSRVVLINESFAQDVFARKRVAGEQLHINGTSFEVIGVVEDPAFSSGPDGFSFQEVYMPLSTLRKYFAPAQEADLVPSISVYFTAGTNVSSLQNRINSFLLRRHSMLHKEGEFIHIINRQQEIETFNSVLLGIQVFISAIAAISLLVGGIGIMNIMLVTVKERTKEIGLRKAIGAKKKDILMQFLFEAIILTSIGGVIGITAGLGLSALGVFVVNIMRPDWDVKFLLVIPAIVTAYAVAALVGLVFGIYPARRAASLHPIDALRYE